MHLVRVVTWVVVATAAVLPGHPARTSPAPGPAASQAEVTRLVAVPAPVSFDDLSPSEAAARPDASAAVPAVRPRSSPPRPPRSGADGSSPPAGTPQAVLAMAYRRAVSGAARGCHLDVAHLAAIGQVESGSIGGRTVTSDHRVSPAIYGPLLDGGPFAVVRDSDNGRYDGAGDFDRAVGPLQFLPGTWSWAGRDGDADGRQDPQNVFDAAAATAGYLCRDGRDLSRAGDLRSAVLSYNQSDAYHSAVLEWVAYFQRHGLASLPTVAFRVGSGGRASDLATAPEPTPPPPSAARTPRPTSGESTPRPTSIHTSTGTRTTAPTDETPPGTPTGSTTSGTPAPPATTTAPPPTTPTPATTTPSAGPTTVQAPRPVTPPGTAAR